jgi:hypothetical protein
MILTQNAHELTRTQGGVTLGRGQGEPGADFTSLDGFKVKSNREQCFRSSVNLRIS